MRRGRRVADSDLSPGGMGGWEGQREAERDAGVCLFTIKTQEAQIQQGIDCLRLLSAGHRLSEAPLCWLSVPHPDVWTYIIVPSPWFCMLSCFLSLCIFVSLCKSPWLRGIVWLSFNLSSNTRSCSVFLPFSRAEGLFF